MKKLLLFSLLCVIAHLSAYSDSDVIKSLTMYVGSSITLSPYHDREGVPGYDFSSIDDSYALSEYDIVSVEKRDTIISSNMYSTWKEPSFKLTALKVGSCNLAVFIHYQKRYYSGGWNTSWAKERILYKITVIEAPKVVSITIPNFLNLNVGENYTFSPIIAEPGANTTLSWSSTNPGVATVSNGAVQAVAPGTATIICTAANGISAQCLVTVNPQQDLLPGIVDKTIDLTVTVGCPFVVTPISELPIAPSDASTPVPYVLSDPSAFTVNYSEYQGFLGTSDAPAGVYRTYTITPEKVGRFVFKETVAATIGKKPSGTYTKAGTITYNINVVASTPTVLGDMDGDGQVTISDVTKVIEIYLEGKRK